MPCDQVSSTLIQLDKADPQQIQEALKSMGHNLTVNGEIVYFSGGYYNVRSKELTLRGGNPEAFQSELRRAYMAVGVKAQAKRFGWKVRETGKYEYQLSKQRI